RVNPGALLGLFSRSATFRHFPLQRVAMVTSPGSWWQSRTFAPPAMESHSRGRGFDSPRLHFHATGTPIARSTAFSTHPTRREGVAQRSRDETIAAQRRDLLTLCHGGAAQSALASSQSHVGRGLTEHAR